MTIFGIPNGVTVSNIVPIYLLVMGLADYAFFGMVKWNGQGPRGRGMFGQFWSNSPVAPSMLLGAVAPSVCILIYNENICFCQPYSRHKYRVAHLG